MLIYPAMDLRGGQVVRLRQGDYAQETVFSTDPLAVARQFEEAGATWLHCVDLDGAKSGQPENLDIIHRISSETSLNVQLGGGIRSMQTAEAILEKGIQRVILGTVLVKDDALAKTVFVTLGDQVVAGIDAKDGKVAVNGWTEESQLELIEFCLRMQGYGAKHFIVTDIAKDGMMQGPSVGLYEELGKLLGSGIIASGGVTNLQDLETLQGVQGVSGAIVGRAFYENTIPLSALSQ